MSDIAVKICGLTTQPTINAAIDAGSEYLGFVFYPPSPRNITPKKAADLARHIPPSVHKVAVVVDADDGLLSSIVSTLQPDFLQLHGNETPERVAEIKAGYGLKVIKAFKIRSADDVARAGQYGDIADMFLFDARAPEGGALPGGNGLSFDWLLLQGRRFPVSWMLSGGLNATNVGEAIKTSGATMVDVSSSLESSPGVKDPALIRKFMQAVASL